LTDEATWRPTTERAALRLRAETLARLRGFFAERGVLEVETPLLSGAANTDPQLASFQTRYAGPGDAAGRSLFLNTSPEFAMKRLLAAGSGPIYQVCKAFRQGEAGRLHNPEFTLLEWYRPGFDHFQLMVEVADLIGVLARDHLPLEAAEWLDYGELFRHRLGVDPHTAPVAELEACARRFIALDATLSLERDGWLDLLMSHAIQPRLGQGRVSFVYHYPASQAALARIRPGEPPLAERFEVFLNGVELANGFHELADSSQQRARFEADLRQRQESGAEPVPLDEHLLAALAHGFPDCAGVALGLDRLLLVLAGGEALSQVLSFPLARA
jgi:lysyl-tRNA synthetase class 2